MTGTGTQTARTEAAETSAERIRLGVITAPHGVRGLVRVKSFTDNPTDLCAYGPLTDAGGGAPLALKIVGESRGALLARIDGVCDRDAAERHRGTALYIARTALPELPDADEYYHADLIGLIAVDTGCEPLGRIRAVHNHGAGDVLEIALEDGGDLLVAFTREAVPSVDLETGVAVVAPPRDDASQADSPEADIPGTDIPEPDAPEAGASEADAPEVGIPDSAGGGGAREAPAKATGR